MKSMPGKTEGEDRRTKVESQPGRRDGANGGIRKTNGAVSAERVPIDRFSTTPHTLEAPHDDNYGSGFGREDFQHQSDVHHQPDRGLRRHPPGARTGQRDQPQLRPRHAGAGGAQGAAGVDGGREDRDSARDRRQGDSHRRDRKSRDAARSPARARRVSQGQPGARPASDRCRSRSAARVGLLAVGRPRRRRAARRRAAGHVLASDHQRVDHARPVEDGVPGRDRLRLGDDRLLALQHLLRAGALRRAAGQQPRHVELDGVPPARGLHLRHHPVQLHRDRRQPDDGAGADGEHA